MFYCLSYQSEGIYTDDANRGVKHSQLVVPLNILFISLVEGFNTLSAGGLNLPAKRVDPGYWLRSGFESPLVVSLFQDPISYGRFSGATL